jgi:hypothetical protein
MYSDSSHVTDSYSWPSHLTKYNYLSSSRMHSIVNYAWLMSDPSWTSKSVVEFDLTRFVESLLVRSSKFANCV